MFSGLNFALVGISNKQRQIIVPRVVKANGSVLEVQKSTSGEKVASSYTGLTHILCEDEHITADDIKKALCWESIATVPILHTSWLHKSLKNGVTLNEEPYEIK